MDDLILLLDDRRDDLVMLIDEDEDLILETDAAVIVTYKEYEGEYTVIPILYNDQVLSTENRVLKQDVTVKPIPVIQTTNPYGGQTVVIG